MKDFDIEKLERRNIYKVPDNLFENIQEKVMSEISEKKKAPVFKLNWAYAAAASLALIFGSTFVYNSYSDSDEDVNPTSTLADNQSAPKTESEIAYETLKSDLTSVENINQRSEKQQIKTVVYMPDQKDVTATKPQTVKPGSKQTETQMAEYLDSFSSSEIAELANNSTQDVYLDLYN